MAILPAARWFRLLARRPPFAARWYRPSGKMSLAAPPVRPSRVGAGPASLRAGPSSESMRPSTDICRFRSLGKTSPAAPPVSPSRVGAGPASLRAGPSSESMRPPTVIFPRTKSSVAPRSCRDGRPNIPPECSRATTTSVSTVWFPTVIGKLITPHTGVTNGLMGGAPRRGSPAAGSPAAGTAAEVGRRGGL